MRYAPVERTAFGVRLGLNVALSPSETLTRAAAWKELSQVRHRGGREPDLDMETNAAPQRPGSEQMPKGETEFSSNKLER